MIKDPTLEVVVVKNTWHVKDCRDKSSSDRNTDRSKAVLLLWFLTVTCFCCPYLSFGSPIMLATYFSKFYVAEWPPD